MKNAKNLDSTSLTQIINRCALPHKIPLRFARLSLQSVQRIQEL